MMAMIQLTEEQIKLIEFVISTGDRAEVIPVKDGAKVLRVKRYEVKPKNR